MQLFVYILYVFCIQIICIVLIVDQNSCIQNVYKMYTKCIPHFDKLLYTFGIEILTAIVLLILCTKCIQKFVKMWDAFYTYLVYILYMSVVYILYNFCIQNVHTISMRELSFWHLYLPKKLKMYIIKTLNLGKALGPNSIPTKLLKQFSKAISIPLYKLINLSFEKGIFPDSLKLGKRYPSTQKRQPPYKSQLLLHIINFKYQ